MLQPKEALSLRLFCIPLLFDLLIILDLAILDPVFSP